MSPWIFSQNGLNKFNDLLNDSVYPKKFMHNGDTLVIIKFSQLVKANVAYQESLKYKELSDSLNSLLKRSDIIILAYQDLVKSYKEEKTIYESIMFNQDLLSSNDSIMKKQLNKLLADNKSIIGKEKLKSGFLYTFIGVLVVTTTLACAKSFIK